MINGTVMKGPTPTMLLMLSAVACKSPSPRINPGSRPRSSRVAVKRQDSETRAERRRKSTAFFVMEMFERVQTRISTILPPLAAAMELKSIDTVQA
jgi:hypothetical protein